MWDLPRPGLEPVSPALAGRLSTTAPPGKPEGLILIDRARELGGKRAVLAMIDSLRPYPRFFFSWMLGGWKQPLAALSHPMATSTHTQSTCNSSDSGKWPYGLLWSVPVGREGLWPEHQLSWTWLLHVEDWSRVRGFHWDPLLPNSLLCVRCLIAPDNGQDWTERSPDPKGSWRHKSAYSLHCPPFVLSNSHIAGLWPLSLSFMWQFSKLPCLTLSFYPVLLQGIAMCNLVLQLL